MTKGGLCDWANFVFWVILKKKLKYQVQGIVDKCTDLKTNVGLW